MLTEDGYHYHGESIISKIFQTITNIQSLSHPQQPHATNIQEELIRISIIYVKLKILKKNFGVYSNLTK